MFKSEMQITQEFVLLLTVVRNVIEAMPMIGTEGT